MAHEVLLLFFTLLILPVICELIEKAFADMQESDHQEHHLVDRQHKSDTYIQELSLVVKTQNECVVSRLSVLYTQNGRKVTVWILFRYEKVKI